jgi:putative redox protein
MSEVKRETSPAAGNAESGRWVTARTGPSGFRTELQARGHALITDEPTALGGTDAGPTPYELLLSALSGCMAITLRMYADRKGWPLEDVRVHMRTARSHEPDCEHCDTESVGITLIERRVELSGPLTDEQRKRLMLVADRCPVKQTFERGIRIEAVP